MQWKIDCKFEDVFNYLTQLLSQHKYSVALANDVRDDPDFEDEPGIDEYWAAVLENVNPNASLLSFSFQLQKVLPKIKFRSKDPGSQLLTGSFHPVDDALWDKDVKLSPGAHTFVRIVLEDIRYEETTPWDFKVTSADFVRKAVSKILTFTNSAAYYFKNKKMGWGDTAYVEPPIWWKSRLVLVMAATPEQVKEFQLQIEYAKCEVYEHFSYEAFTIHVGDDVNSYEISLAQAMAQPALNRCMTCGLELFIPNRCVS